MSLEVTPESFCPTSLSNILLIKIWCPAPLSCRMLGNKTAFVYNGLLRFLPLLVVASCSCIQFTWGIGWLGLQQIKISMQYYINAEAHLLEKKNLSVILSWYICAKKEGVQRKATNKIKHVLCGKQLCPCCLSGISTQWLFITNIISDGSTNHQVTY